jgi:hypothetical protein
MFIAILTLLSALSISGVAIFYSVIGLATIFPGAFIPVVIMGGVLEVGKLITASWLYRNWKFTPFMLKTYLTTAVIILSLITSMGIFGFLSKAHLEQNLASDTLIQRIQILNDKIDSEKNSIARQNAVIDRLEKSINRSTGTADGDIEVQQSIIKDANEKLKTLLTVETNTVRDLNDRLKVLDKNVSDILNSNKSFFNEEKASADLKTSQKEERERIAVKVAEAQDRIAELKTDHKLETAEAKTIIATMREGSQENKGTFTQDIETAEQKIFDSQGRIDIFIVDKQPLEKSMLTLEAEIGPVKYIAALAVDWGWTDKVETSKAVRWVILIIIVVFDPLAVLLLIAANQSLMRRFPPEAPKPQEIVDLEKPDEEDVTLKWNEMMDKSEDATKMEKATAQLQEWKEKLEAFNTKLPKPEAEVPVEIIQQDDSVPHIDLKGQKKTEQEEINAYKDKKAKEEEYEQKIQEQAEKEKQLERFKQREKEEQEALEEVARKAREEELVEESIADDIKETVVATDEYNFEDEVAYDIDPVVNPEWDKDQEPTISEQIEEVMEPERTRPDFTEVIDTEQAVQEMMENPKKAMEEDIQIVQETARKTHLADMDELAVEPEIGEFTSGYKPMFVKKSQEKINKDAYVQNEEQTDNTAWKKIKTKQTSEDQYHEFRYESVLDQILWFNICKMILRFVVLYTCTKPYTTVLASLYLFLKFCERSTNYEHYILRVYCDHLCVWMFPASLWRYPTF